MNKRRHTIEWGLAFAALGFTDATVMRFFSAGGERLVWLAMFSLCLAFVGVAVRRIGRMTL